MYKKSAAPQVSYSLDALSHSLFRLMQTNTFETITISELCKDAQITRNTYYRNCTDKIDLVDYAIEKEVLALFQVVDWDCTDPVKMYTVFFCFWKERHELLTVLYHQGLFYRLNAILIHLCMEKRYAFLESFLTNKESPDTLNLFYNTFINGGLCEMMKQWTKDGFVTSVADLVSVLTHLIPASTTSRFPDEYAAASLTLS